MTAEDAATSTIVHSNANGTLVAFTGARSNTLVGSTGTNDFTTAARGTSAVVLAGTSNALHYGGADTVQVTGPSQITATPGCQNSIAVQAATTLSFINQSSITSSITGAAGSTSIGAETGAERFSIDTTAGNVTIAGSASGVDTIDVFEQTQGSSGHTATVTVTVNSFAANDQLVFSNYGTPSTESMSGSGRTVTTTFTLRDGSRVIVNGPPCRRPR